MAFVVADRVQETCTSPGTGTVTLLGAVYQFQTFSSAIGANNTTYYVIADQVGANWEVGLGTVGAAGTTLARTTVLASSNGGSIVNFLTGNQYVWVDYPASKIVVQGGAVSFSSITNSGLASGRVVYTTTGGLETSSASFLYDGTALTAGNFVPSSATVPTYGMYLPITNAIGFTTASTERMRIDSSGNLGLGVTPSAWNSLFKAIQVGNIASFGYDNSFGQTVVTNNAYGTGSAAYTYLNATSLQAARYEQKLGTHAWFTAPSGTAGNAITFTQAMTLFASGGLSLGNITDAGAGNLSVTGSVTGTSLVSSGSLSAVSNAVGSVTAATGGLTAVTAVAGSLTLATGGVTLASQVMASGSVWRVTAYGTYVAASSANARTLTMACYWGATKLTSVTTGNVLSAVAQTTAWKVELEISGSSATAAWCTGLLSAQVTSAIIPLNYAATAASVTGLTTTSTLDFQVGQTGTATATDTINVHSVVLERIK